MVLHRSECSRSTIDKLRSSRIQFKDSTMFDVLCPYRFPGKRGVPTAPSLNFVGSLLACGDISSSSTSLDKSVDDRDSDAREGDGEAEDDGDGNSRYGFGG